MTNPVYRIRRVKDGLYSTGGNTPNFVRSGKLFTNIEFLEHHLRALRKLYESEMALGRHPSNPYDGCVVETLMPSAECPVLMENFSMDLLASMLKVST